MRRSDRRGWRVELLERRRPLAGLVSECRLADVDDNGVVDRADAALVANHFGGAVGRNSGGDTDGNAVVNLRDLIAVQSQLGNDCTEPPIRFAAFGDYGLDGPDEAAVAALVKSWNPDFIVTLGDNNYGVGAAETIDANIGKHYQEFIGDYAGAYGPGSPTNRFFPSLGNHDWWYPGVESIAPYLDYFTLPGEGFTSSSGNERYYDFRWGPVHFFAVSASRHDPDGYTPNSVQGRWLQHGIAKSTAPWQIVYFHESPYSSGSDSGSTPYMQWPFDAWGADLVLSAHDHNYERLAVNGLTYLVAGTGGAALRVMSPSVPGSIVTYNEAHGALLITADATSIRAEFHSVAGGDTVIDCVAIGATTCGPGASPNAPVTIAAAVVRRVVAMEEIGTAPRVLRAARHGAWRPSQGALRHDEQHAAAQPHVDRSARTRRVGKTGDEQRATDIAIDRWMVRRHD